MLRQTSVKRLAVAAAFSTFAAIAALPAAGQGLLEEIIVTAEKREAALSDTPIAITALTADVMKDLGIYSQQEISNFTPSMSYQETAGGGEGNRVYLRGIGRETSSTGTEPGVGVYNDGFYTNESGVLLGSTDRIERIEILRGPQGTLYGKNTTGGAINVYSKKPGDEFEHILRAIVGNYSARDLAFTSSGPVTDWLGYLLHYNKIDQDSFFENVSGPDPIGADSEYIEGQFTVDFTDQISWNVRYFSASFENETLERAKLGGYRNEVGAPPALGPIVMNPEAFALLPQAPAQTDVFKLSSDFQGRVAVDDQDTYQSTLTIDLDSLTIKLLNGYQEYSWFGQKDFDGTFSPVSYIETIGQAEETTQHEIQFISNGDGNIDWVVGLFYLNNETNQPYKLTDANNPHLINNLSGFPNPEGIFYEQRGIAESTSQAVYGQFTYSVNEKLSLTAGMRYSEDEKEGFETQTIFFDSAADLNFCSQAGFEILRVNNDPYGTAPGCARFGILVSDLEASHEAEWDAVDWRLNASYFLAPEHMLYATVSTGYKPGGFRLGGFQDDPATLENESIVNNEELTAFELGYKGGVEGVWNISAAAFFYDYEDIQVELSFRDPNAGIVTSRLANASNTDVWGFEMESSWAATERLTILGNYSYLKSEYKDEFLVVDLKSETERNAQGNRLNRTPKNKFTLAANYVQPLVQGDLVFSGNFSFVDDQFMTVFNDDVEKVDSYTQINARISWRAESYELALFGKNLTDEISFANDLSVSGLEDGNRTTVRPLSPRTYGVEAVYRF